MLIGLQIPDFSWPGGPSTLGADLAEIARAADDLGFEFLAVMDHFFQIDMIGPPERDMLEAYTTLGFLAGHTRRAKLLALVTGALYRHPGILIKQVSTLDVLSGGRAWLGIGAGWFEAEARGLGVPYPGTGERLARLEETLQIAHQMWRDDESAYHGRYYQLERPLNRPAPITRPHPPIMVGGSGERKTLRLVAQYADACNLFPSPDLPHKLDVLRRHCDEVGRDYDEITKTVLTTFDIADDGTGVETTLQTLKGWADQGVQIVIANVPEVWQLGRLERIGQEIIPQAAGF